MTNGLYKKQTHKKKHKLTQQVCSYIFRIKETGPKMTTTHTTTDLGLWWSYTDQGKTPWRIKTLRMREKTLHEEKNPNNREWIQNLHI